MLLENKTIFLLGHAKYDGPYESTSYTVAKELAKHNDVYYVDYPFTWKDYFKKPNIDEFNRRAPYFKLNSDGIISTDIPRLKILVSMPLASINFLPEGKLYRFMLGINESVILSRIKKLIRKKNITSYIWFNSFNFHYPGLGAKLKPAATIYQCVDPLIIDYDVKHGVVSENQLVRESNLVICTSRELYTQKKLLNPNTRFVPNAADVTHSAKALDPQLPVHESVADLPKPVVGYFGTIERRFDFDLLKQVTAANPDKSFVFIGPVSPEMVPDWFYHTPNIHLRGRMPYKDLPSILKGFDVAIIPFKCDEVSSTIFPLKLFEYLGSGKPVVITNFNPDLQEFTGNTVPFTNGAAEFTNAINEALINDNDSKKQERIQVAANNTWEKRGNEIAELIATYLNKTNAV